jgi:hypothetical protein
MLLFAEEYRPFELMFFFDFSDGDVAALTT